MTQVFISYARLDDKLTSITEAEEHTYHLAPKRSFTRRLYNALTDAGFEAWWDRENMPNRGPTFRTEIKQAIGDSDFLVYVAGENALNRPHVRAEWEYAVSLCKPVISVLRNSDYHIIPPEIAMGNSPDMRDMSYFDEKIKELVRMLSDTPKLATIYGGDILPDWYIERSNYVLDIG